MTGQERIAPMQEQNRRQLTVDELTLRIAGLFFRDPVLQSAAVLGELSELKRHTSGHVYFTLLGKESRISCALFRNYLPHGVPQWPMNGDEVLAEGSVSVYGPRGSYQLLVRRLVPVGKGAAERARKELMERLAREGLFDERLKRPLPPYPEKVAVVTSPTGAAVKDVITVSAGRLPSCALVIVPAHVQGMEAPEEITAALGRVSAIPSVDCALLVRGGGSRDDLAPFDDERVVRAVRLCPVPIVTGVGHDADETLSDLAADAFAPTPSAAAEKVFPDRKSLLGILGHNHRMALSGVERAMRSEERDLLSFLQRGRRPAEACIHAGDSSAGLFLAKLRSGMEASLFRCREQLGGLAASLNGLSPLRAFDRGYVLCEKDGIPVKAIADLEEDDQVRLRFRDGDALAEVRGLSGRDPVSG